MMNPDQSKTQPLNGAFTIVTFANHIGMILVPNTDRWELPGGGEEPEDQQSLLETAIREAKEEMKVTIRKKRMIKVGKFIQRFKGRDDEGTVELFQAQTFHFTESFLQPKDNMVYKKSADKVLETTSEAEIIRFIHVSAIIDGTFNVNLAHRRMVLHWLNWTSLRVSNQPPIEARLGHEVTARVPRPKHGKNSTFSCTL